MDNNVINASPTSAEAMYVIEGLPVSPVTGLGLTEPPGTSGVTITTTGGSVGVAVITSGGCVIIGAGVNVGDGVEV